MLWCPSTLWLIYSKTSCTLYRLNYLHMQCYKFFPQSAFTMMNWFEFFCDLRVCFSWKMKFLMSSVWDTSCFQHLPICTQKPLAYFSRKMKFLMSLVWDTSCFRHLPVHTLKPLARYVHLKTLPLSIQNASAELKYIWAVL